MNWADGISRLKVSVATGRIPRDVGEWALLQLSEIAPVAARLEERDGLLRGAVSGLSGSRWAKARRLQREIVAASSGRTRPVEDDPVRAAVRRALALDPGTPRSVRQLLRVLGE